MLDLHPSAGEMIGQGQQGGNAVLSVHLTWE
jgi:hypothetical protein